MCRFFVALGKLCYIGHTVAVSQEPQTKAMMRVSVPTELRPEQLHPDSNGAVFEGLSQEPSFSWPSEQPSDQEVAEGVAKAPKAAPPVKVKQIPMLVVSDSEGQTHKMDFKEVSQSLRADQKAQMPKLESNQKAHSTQNAITTATSVPSKSKEGDVEVPASGKLDHPMDSMAKQVLNEMQHGETLPAVTWIPTLAPQVGESAKKAEANMADAVDQELEGTHAAETSSEQMALAMAQSGQAAVTTAADYVSKVVKQALEVSSKSQELTHSIVAHTTASITRSLDEANWRSSAIVSQLNHARTQAQMVESLTASEQNAKATSEMAVRIAGDVHDAVFRIKNISMDVSLLAQKAVEDMQAVKRKTLTDMNKMSDQLVSVGLAFSSKMAARNDAEVIADRLARTADEIKVSAKEIGDKVDVNKSDLRSKLDQTIEDMGVQAAALQMKGDVIARQLADAAKRSQDAHIKGEGKWLQSEISAVNIVEAAAQDAKSSFSSPSEVTKTHDTQKDTANNYEWASVINSWHLDTMLPLMLLVFVAMAAYSFFSRKVHG